MHIKNHTHPEKTYHNIKLYQFWASNLRNLTFEIVPTCTKCMEFNKLNVKTRPPLSRVSSDGPMQHIHVDLANFGHKNKDGYDTFLVMVDNYT